MRVLTTATATFSPPLSASSQTPLICRLRRNARRSRQQAATRREVTAHLRSTSEQRCRCRCAKNNNND